METLQEVPLQNLLEGSAGAGCVANGNDEASVGKMVSQPMARQCMEHASWMPLQRCRGKRSLRCRVGWLGLLYVGIGEGKGGSRLAAPVRGSLWL